MTQSDKNTVPAYEIDQSGLGRIVQVVNYVSSSVLAHGYEHQRECLAMPKYYFDVYNDISTLDDAGSDLADIDTARGVAQDILADLARNFPANGAVSHHRVIVRGQSGKRLLEAVLTHQCVMISDEEN